MKNHKAQLLAFLTAVLFAVVSKADDFASKEELVEHLAKEILSLGGDYHISVLKPGTGTENHALYKVDTTKDNFLVKFTVRTKTNTEQFLGNERVQDAMLESGFQSRHIVLPVYRADLSAEGIDFIVSIQPFISGKSIASYLNSWSFKVADDTIHQHIERMFFYYGKRLGGFHAATLRQEEGGTGTAMLTATHLKGRSLDNTVVESKALLDVFLIDFEYPGAGTRGYLRNELSQAILSIYYAFSQKIKRYFTDDDLICIKIKGVESMLKVNKCRKIIQRNASKAPQPIARFLTGYLSAFDSDAAYYPSLKETVGSALLEAYWQTQ